MLNLLASEAGRNVLNVTVLHIESGRARFTYCKKLRQELLTSYMWWLGLVLGPYGSGKSRNLQFFRCLLGKPPVKIFNLDGQVFATEKYQKTVGSKKALRKTYLSLVRSVQQDFDRDFQVALEGRKSLLLEESGRSPWFASWFILNVIRQVKKNHGKIAIFYTLVDENLGWERCVRRIGPHIPRKDFESCRRTCVEALCTLAPEVDRLEIFSSATHEPTFLWKKGGQASASLRHQILATLHPPSELFHARVSNLLEGTTPPGRVWVTLVMNGDRYVPGALVLAHSLKNVNSKFPAICMVTDDVSEKAISMLQKVFDEVRRIRRIACPSRRLTGEKQMNLYSAEFCDSVFSKWTCLKFTEFEKVIFVDADVIFEKNPDSLFDLRAPAATFANPWSRSSWYKNLRHGSGVSSTLIRQAFGHPRAYVAYGSLVLLEPDEDTYCRLLQVLSSEEPYGKGLKSISGMDELCITELFVPRIANLNSPSKVWTHIDPKFHLIPWKRYPGVGQTTCKNAVGIHYFGKQKPWEMRRGAWEDIALWWDLFDDLRTSFSEIEETLIEQ